MPMFALPIVTWLLGNKWLWFVGAAIVVVAVYFGWRSQQRGIGAAKVIDQLQKAHINAVEKGNKARADAGSGSERDKRLHDRFRRD